MLRMGGRLGLLPEQVWDGQPVPERRLFPGRPSGSAMPLAWAHSEFVKLAVSVKKGYPVDRPEAVWLRYAGQKPHSERAHWTPRMPVSTIRKGRTLRILNDTPMLVRWSTEEAREPAETPSTPGGLGLHAIGLPAEALAAGRMITFSASAWEGKKYAIRIIDPEAP
jgi:glucoamylase